VDALLVETVETLTALLVCAYILIPALRAVLTEKPNTDPEQQYRNAKKEFVVWRMRNPDTYVGQSADGMRLVWNLIEAHEIFLLQYPCIDGNQTRARYRSLLHELPPLPPKKGPTQCRSFVYLFL
jgi:hypothetical protein